MQSRGGLMAMVVSRLMDRTKNYPHKGKSHEKMRNEYDHKFNCDGQLEARQERRESTYLKTQIEWQERILYDSFKRATFIYTSC